MELKLDRRWVVFCKFFENSFLLTSNCHSCRKCHFGNKSNVYWRGFNGFSLIVNMHIYSNLSSKFHMEVRMGRNQGVGRGEGSGGWLRSTSLLLSGAELLPPSPPAGSSKLAVGILRPCAILFLRNMFWAVTRSSRPTAAELPQCVVPEVLALTLGTWNATRIQKEVSKRMIPCWLVEPFAC